MAKGKEFSHARVGSGKRFEACERKVGKHVKNPGAVCASIGRHKYGKKRFQAMAAAGHRRG